MLQYEAVARATGCGTVAEEGQKQEMTFRTRQTGLVLRIEKLNSHPRAQDFDRHRLVSFSRQLIHHFIAITDNDLESSFIAAILASGLLRLLSACALFRMSK